ncbi:uncharacterized protein [Elaeis guineensis]|uniref:uncharacterized protein isoform X2 n=1 Tax=Elaeis guineensis var. tenera TaxID=51953 RepID=UPI00057B47F4
MRFRRDAHPASGGPHRAAGVQAAPREGRRRPRGAGCRRRGRCRRRTGDWSIFWTSKLGSLSSRIQIARLALEMEDRLIELEVIQKVLLRGYRKKLQLSWRMSVQLF